MSAHGNGLGFPRLYAAASLKRQLLTAAFGLAIGGFPRLYAAASLKPRGARGVRAVLFGFPRLYAAASLKPARADDRDVALGGFPRLYAAASLKHHRILLPRPVVERFSAALCRGLIEARASCAALSSSARVFRGFMPRPH